MHTFLDGNAIHHLRHQRNENKHVIEVPIHESYNAPYRLAKILAGLGESDTEGAKIIEDVEPRSERMHGKRRTYPLSSIG